MTSRIIHTDMYTPRAQFILERLREYLHYNWGSSQMHRNIRYFKIEVQPNGEVTFVIDNDSYSYRYTAFSNKNDNQVKQWFALHIKLIADRELKYNNADKINWSRSSNWILPHFKDAKKPDIPGVTAAELYFVYDKLTNSKKMNKRWTDKKFVKSLVGEERDPVATELEIARREELVKIEKKYNADKRKLDDDCYEEAREAQKLVYDKFDKLKEELKAAYLKAQKDLEDSLSFMTDSSLADSGLL